MVGVGKAIGKMEHGADFAGGAAGNVEKGEEFGGGAAFKALGDIVGDREGGAAELVAEVPGLGLESIAGVGVGLLREIEGGLPYGQVFEAVVFHGDPEFKI